MRYSVLTLSLFSGILLLSACSRSSDKAMINLEEGDQFIIEQHSDQEIVQNFEGNEQKMTTSVDAEMGVEVLERDGENYLFALSYDKLDFSLASLPYMEIHYSSDTSDPMGNVFAQVFSEMLGKKFEVTMNERGEIKEVNGLNPMIREVVENLPSVTERMVAEVTRSMQDMFGDESIYSTFGILSELYPEAPYSEGEKWERKRKDKINFDLNYTTEWQVSSLDRNEARIEGLGDIVSSGEEESAVREGMPSLEAGGEFEAEVSMDRSRGFISELNSNFDVQGEMVVSDQSGTMRVPVTMKGNDGLRVKF